MRFLISEEKPYLKYLNRFKPPQSGGNLEAFNY